MLKRMQARMACLMFLLPLSAMAGVPEGPRDLLRADFDDKALNAPIGTGGAQVGEPTEIIALQTLIVDCASARASEAGIDKCLRVDNDLSSTSARPVRWQFVDNEEITSGVLTLSFDFQSAALDRYNFQVREANSSASSFLSLSTNPSGGFSASDANGVIPINPLSYAAGQWIRLRFDFDMDAGTSQVSINGALLFSGRAHGITTRGVGRFNTGFGSNNNGSTFLLNNLLVQTRGPLPIVLDADFDGQPLAQPLGTAGASAQQPVSIDAAIATEVIAAGPGNQALQMTLPNAQSGTRYMRWQLLDDIEVEPGFVAFEADVQFENLNSYAFAVRETITSASNYAQVTFTPAGAIAILDASGSGVIPGASYQADVRYRLRLLFDQAQGVYTLQLDDAVLIANRAHGVSSGRGIGALLIGFSNITTAGAGIIIDDLQVGASAAPGIASELAILQQPSTGAPGQALSPPLQIGVLNVFDELVSDGTMVSIDVASGPMGATLAQSSAGTLAGMASFPALTASSAGQYQLRARADRAEVVSTTPLTIVAPAINLFRDGFEPITR